MRNIVVISILMLRSRREAAFRSAHSAFSSTTVDRLTGAQECLPLRESEVSCAAAGDEQDGSTNKKNIRNLPAGSSLGIDAVLNAASIRSTGMSDVLSRQKADV
jgi:hypothetical protein